MNLNDVFQLGKRCAFYGRVSTNKQDLDLQIDAMNTFAKQYEIEIVKWYTDQGVSATKKAKSQRKQLNELINDLTDDIFDYVAVYKIDRISRDPLETSEIRSVFAAANKPIVILSDSPPSVDDEPEDIFGFLKSAIAKYEVDQNRDRTRSKAEASAKEGKPLGGRIPYGYQYNPTEKSFEQIPSEANTVKKIFELYAEGQSCNKLPNIFMSLLMIKNGLGKRLSTF
ncbi:hypothetical protein BHU72_09970 [Desulfuribacillus stibiiarsenatis]|uniref:Resolvase/invertase-type recombinase catalytic domain-containing protein n=1 Tax=Desulfuribacillus stibiiarsenatis TaxID=1390249 RepID=A0A1E5L946_9FIRM|nr:recombinase family protein [Desulfuribacillus stibiiarsenatis]OEH86578.1 hypothetical protein BHU72_09970 [Desulfuribacillus stibiiarsenatis]